MDNGYNSANSIYYNIFLNSFDFSKINKDDESIKSFMKTIWDVLINNFVLDEVRSYYEYFFLRKILIKKFNFKSILDEYNDYTKEFTDFIINITSLETTNDDINNNFMQIEDNTKENRG